MSAVQENRGIVILYSRPTLDIDSMFAILFENQCPFYLSCSSANICAVVTSAGLCGFSLKKRETR